MPERNSQILQEMLKDKKKNIQLGASTKHGEVELKHETEEVESERICDS